MALSGTGATFAAWEAVISSAVGGGHKQRYSAWTGVCIRRRHLAEGPADRVLTATDTPRFSAQPNGPGCTHCELGGCLGTCFAKLVLAKPGIHRGLLTQLSHVNLGKDIHDRS